MTIRDSKFSGNISCDSVAETNDADNLSSSVFTLNQDEENCSKNNRQFNQETYVEKNESIKSFSHVFDDNRDTSEFIAFPETSPNGDVQNANTTQYHNAAFAYHFYAAHCSSQDYSLKDLDVTSAEDTNLSVTARKHLVDRFEIILRNLRNEKNALSDSLDFLVFWKSVEWFDENDSTSEDEVLKGMVLFRDRVIDEFEKNNHENLASEKVKQIVTEVKQASHYEGYWDAVLKAVPTDSEQLSRGELSDAIYMFMRDYMDREEDGSEKEHSQDQSFVIQKSPVILENVGVSRSLSTKNLHVHEMALRHSSANQAPGDPNTLQAIQSSLTSLHTNINELKSTLNDYKNENNITPFDFNRKKALETSSNSMKDVVRTAVTGLLTSTANACCVSNSSCTYQ